MTSPWLKVADLHPQARRGRPPVLVGFIGPYKLLLVERHNPGLGEPKATLFVTRRQDNTNNRMPQTETGRATAAKALALLLNPEP
jgi:hypothetical protein